MLLLETHQLQGADHNFPSSHHVIVDYFTGTACDAMVRSRQRTCDKICENRGKDVHARLKKRFALQMHESADRASALNLIFDELFKERSERREYPENRKKQRRRDAQRFLDRVVYNPRQLRAF